MEPTYGPCVELATLGIGTQPTGTPKPVSLNVFHGGKIIASLDIKQVRAIVKRWDEMLDAYERAYGK